MKKKAIIVDLDGTLCDITERRKFITGDTKDWESFSDPKEIAKDKLNEWCRDLVLAMREKVDYVLFVTGRMEKAGVRQSTVFWIMDNVHLYDSCHLFMRADKDYRKDTEIKAEIYERDIEPYYDVLFCVDDRQSVVDMWRSKGLVCLQCDVGDF